MDHKFIPVIVLLSGLVTAMLLCVVTLVAIDLKQRTSVRTVRLLVITFTVLLYVISPLAFDAVVVSLVQRKDLTYVAVDLAWWVGLTPLLLAAVAVALVQMLLDRRRRATSR